VGPAVRVRRLRRRGHRGTAVDDAAARQRGVEHGSRSPRGDPGSVAAVALRRQRLRRCSSRGRRLAHSAASVLLPRVHLGRRHRRPDRGAPGASISHPGSTSASGFLFDLTRHSRIGSPSPSDERSNHGGRLRDQYPQPPPHPAAHTHPTRPGVGTRAVPAAATRRRTLSRTRSPCAGEPNRLEQRGQHADHLLDMRFEVHPRVQQMAALTEPGQRQRVHAVTVESYLSVRGS
jgi:hypothetical protein